MIPLYVATALLLIVLLLTIKAAPIMLAVAAPQTAATSAHAFDAFYFWGLDLRGAVDALAFVAAIWALVTLQRER